MSSPFKSLKKVFRKVAKTVKKIALPALAIGAVVLTGGAALGVLPSLGALAGQLGATAGLQAVLSTAAQAATFGAVGSLVMGGDPIKGATMGFVTGGVLGGLGAALGGTGAAASTAAQGASTAATPAASTAASVLPPVPEGAGFAEAFAPLANAGPATGGLGTAMMGASPSAAAAPAAMAATTGGALPLVAGDTAGAAKAGNGGFLGWLNANPTIGGMMVQGLGAGIMASQQAKEERRAREAVAASYDGIGDSLFYLPASNGGPALPDAGATYNRRVYGNLAIDPKAGRLVNAGGG